MLAACQLPVVVREGSFDSHVVGEACIGRALDGQWLTAVEAGTTFFGLTNDLPVDDLIIYLRNDRHKARSSRYTSLRDLQPHLQDDLKDLSASRKEQDLVSTSSISMSEKS